MKPDWNNSPPWAKFLAMDPNGDWYWYEFKPTFHGTDWSNNGGQYQVAGETDNGAKDSLESRP